MKGGTGACLGNYYWTKHSSRCSSGLGDASVLNRLSADECVLLTRWALRGQSRQLWRRYGRGLDNGWCCAGTSIRRHGWRRQGKPCIWSICLLSDGICSALGGGGLVPGAILVTTGTGSVRLGFLHPFPWLIAAEMANAPSNTPCTRSLLVRGMWSA